MLNWKLYANCFEEFTTFIKCQLWTIFGFFGETYCCLHWVSQQPCVEHEWHNEITFFTNQATTFYEHKITSRHARSIKQLLCIQSHKVIKCYSDDFVVNKHKYHPSQKLGGAEIFIWRKCSQTTRFNFETGNVFTDQRGVLLRIKKESSQKLRVVWLCCKNFLNMA